MYALEEGPARAPVLSGGIPLDAGQGRHIGWGVSVLVFSEGGGGRCRKACFVKFNG